MDLDRLNIIMDKYHANPDYLIQILLDVQHENGWLSRSVLETIAGRLGVPLNRIYRIVTLYKTFYLVPRGRHIIGVCTGTDCHIQGSQSVLDEVQRLTGIQPGETTPDFNFSLEIVNCPGCCSLGPVMVVDEKLYEKVDVNKIRVILAGYK